MQLIAIPKCRIYNESIKHKKPLQIVDIRNNRKILIDDKFLDYLIDGLNENNEFGTDDLNWFDTNKLISILKEIGFKKVYKSAYGQLKELVLRQVPIFDETLSYLSLYIETRK